MVPAAIQREVYDTYRHGQCDDKRPSRDWHDAASAAIGFVAMRENEGLTKSEARALARRGHGQMLIDYSVRRHGEDRRKAAERVVEELKGERLS
jgi:hypothetical protein